MTDEQVRDLAKELPFERPTAARRDAIRSSLLVEAASTSRSVTTRRWPIVAGFAAGALAAAAIAVLVLRRPAPVIERANLAQVTASADVRLDHQIVATDSGSDEVVRLREGTIALAIPTQRSGDRMVVKTTTADVEGDAGELEITVANEQLQTVKVKTGKARVIVLGQAPVILSAGQTWRASVITADLSPSDPTTKQRAVAPTTPPTDLAALPTPPRTEVAATTVPSTPSRATTTSQAPTSPTAGSTSLTVATGPTTTRPTSPTSTATSPPSTPTATSPTVATTPPVTPSEPVVKPESIEQRFQRGWALLRAGKAQQAAAELGAAADASPSSPLAADARYFQAVALVRANDPRTAERVLVQFLDNAPTSLRRGRAAVLLGRLLAERGDSTAARAWLESAASDPDPAVAAAAKAGLQSLPK